MGWLSFEQVVESYAPDRPKSEEAPEVTIGYQILKELDKLEHNTASTREEDLKDRAAAVKAIKELTNKLLEAHGAQHD